MAETFDDAFAALCHDPEDDENTDYGRGHRAGYDRAIAVLRTEAEREITRLTRELARADTRFMSDHQFSTTGPAPFWCPHCAQPCSFNAPCTGCVVEQQKRDGVAPTYVRAADERAKVRAELLAIADEYSRMAESERGADAREYSTEAGWYRRIADRIAPEPPKEQP